MALPLGSVKRIRETPCRPLYHSSAALPAERDVQKRFLNGRASKCKSVSNPARDFAENNVPANKVR